MTLSAGDYVTATATRVEDAGQVGLDDQLAYGSTSEFSTNLTVVPLNTAPTVTLPGGSVTYTENDPATILDATATITDADSADFDGGTLTIEFTSGGTTDDRLSILNAGTGQQQISISGNEIRHEGTLIGTFTGGTDGTTPLVISFNINADEPPVRDLLRHITYENVSEDPDPSTRTIRFVMTDGDGGTSTAVTKNVDVVAVNDAPSVVPTGSSLAYTENDGAVAIDPFLVITDFDSANLTGATVQFAGGFAPSEDSLGFVDQLGITGSYDAGTGCPDVDRNRLRSRL